MPENLRKPGFRVYVAAVPSRQRYLRPRPFQFSLRGLLGFTAAVAAALSLWKVAGADGIRLLLGSVAFVAFVLAPVVVASFAAAGGRLDFLRTLAVSQLLGLVLLPVNVLASSECFAVVESLLGFSVCFWPVQWAAIGLVIVVWRVEGRASRQDQRQRVAPNAHRVDSRFWEETFRNEGLAEGDPIRQVDSQDGDGRPVDGGPCREQGSLPLKMVAPPVVPRMKSGSAACLWSDSRAFECIRSTTAPTNR